MADISKITLPSNTTYDIKDTTARSGLANKQNTITANGILEGDGNGTITAATTLSTSSLETYTPSTLGIDTVVTSSSSNLITSGAVYTAINNLDLTGKVVFVDNTNTYSQVGAILSAGNYPVYTYTLGGDTFYLPFYGDEVNNGIYRFTASYANSIEEVIVGTNSTWSRYTRSLAQLDTYGKVVASAITAYVTSLSSDTTLSSTYYNNLLKCTGTITITIPTGLATASEIEIMNYGTGTITVSAASGVTLNGTTANSKTITQQYTSAVLKCVDTNEWVIQGAIS